MHGYMHMYSTCTIVSFIPAPPHFDTVKNPHHGTFRPLPNILLPVTLHPVDVHVAVIFYQYTCRESRCLCIHDDPRNTACRPTFLHGQRCRPTVAIEAPLLNHRACTIKDELHYLEGGCSLVVNRTLRSVYPPLS